MYKNKQINKGFLLFSIVCSLIMAFPFVYLSNFTNNYLSYDENLRSDTESIKIKTSFVHEWTKYYGSPASDYFFDIEIDQNDNLFLAGRWGNYYAYLLKLDTDGVEDWNWTWSGGQASDGWGIAIDEENDFIYLAGHYGSYLQPKNVCVVKLDYSGNEIWTTTWNKTNEQYTRDIALDAEGNIYVVGTSYVVDTYQYEYAFLIKFNKTDGSEIYNKTWNPYNDNIANGIDVSPAGDIFVTGQYIYEYDIYGYHYYYEYFFIVKFNSTADQQWQRTYFTASQSFTRGWDITYGDDGYVYAVGGSNRDIRLVKLTVENTQIYSKLYNFSNADEGIGVALDSNYNIYISGGTYNSSTGDWEARMLKCSNSGTLLFNKSLNHPGEDRGYGVAIDSNDNVYYCGHATISGNQEQFLLKMGPPKILPGPFTLSCQPLSAGAFQLIWTDSTHASNYSLYESSSFISEVNEGVILLAEGLQNDPYPIQKTQNGTYYYIVVAFNEHGNASSNCISVEVEIPQDVDFPPQDFELQSDAAIPIDTDGIFILTWTDSLYADNYSLHESSSFISEVNEGVILLAEGLQNDPYSIQKTQNGTYYYIVVAFNEHGNISCNCISIEVGITPEIHPNGEPTISYGMYFLLVSLAVISVVIISLNKKKL